MEIKTQCPITGGKAVPVARGMYQLINDTLSFDDTSNCQQENVRLSNSEVSIINSVVFPNPANHQATLKYILPNETTGLLIVYNVIGNKIFHLKINSKNREQKFNCEKFYEGLYLYKLICEDRVISFGKFSIIR